MVSGRISWYVNFNVSLQFDVISGISLRWGEAGMRNIKRKEQSCFLQETEAILSTFLKKSPKIPLKIKNTFISREPSCQDKAKPEL